MTGRIADIKRFAVHDGDGIRTTVFLKGCPLKCKWCHNPESISFKAQIGYYENKCIHCGKCAEVCSAHRLIDGQHFFVRTKCIGCGKCEKVCLGKALFFYGKEVTVDEVLKVLLEDRDFYEQSGGGITLSGGECLCQADFCAELLKQVKENDIHTAVDTCGFTSKEAINKVLPYTDIFLYDIKHTDEKKHILYTGKSNKPILENIQYINNCCKAIEVRIPFIPTFNDYAMDSIGTFLSPLKMIKNVKVLPYHNFAGSKYDALGMENTLPKVKLPSCEVVLKAVNILKSYGINAVR